ncbi:MAG: hypothetical protein K0V04_20365 [Deltaproteobacteria bacterium]|nr:hypothetical protein [Deltaproteobacteria bacterium]
MLADIEDPPRSRTPGLLLGLLVALPIGIAFLAVVVPYLVNAVLSGASGLDDRIGQEKAYMDAVCTQALALPRDEKLCGCVLATEYAGLDCQAPFMQWSVERQQEHCGVAENKKAALSFCTCVETIAATMSEAPDDASVLSEAQAYRRCQELPDAVYLPTIEALGGSVSE